MRHFIISVYLLFIIMFLGSHCYSADGESNDGESNFLRPTMGTQKPSTLTPFPNKAWMQKMAKRHELEDEGWSLAKRGLYDEAILKFKAATDPLLLNHDYEKGLSESAIIDIYKRQGKFEEALKIVDSQLIVLKNEKKYPNEIAGYERAYNKRLELLALIKARDTNDNNAIYDYINYLKTKYDRFFPPKGYAVGFSDSRIDDLIHLYDYLHDYDAGIAFMDEIIRYHTNHKDPNHRSAHAKDVREYTRVKQAWELDKKTGQHGHLKEVIKTSDVISW